MVTASEYCCTDPSHPPILEQFGQQTLHQRVSEAIEGLVRTGASPGQVVRQVAGDFAVVFREPGDYYGEGLSQQKWRREIAGDWGESFWVLENLGYLAGWSALRSIKHENADQLVRTQSLLLLEAVRVIPAIVNQLRAGLALETLGYLRTMYEISIKMRFLAKHSPNDTYLPSRFVTSIDTAYRERYERFGPRDERGQHRGGVRTADRDDEGVLKGKGDYGWSYPIVHEENGKPKRRPTLSDLINDVEEGSGIDEMLYRIASAKSHADLLFGASGTKPTNVGVIGVDSFSPNHVDDVLAVLLSLFGHAIAAADASSPTDRERLVLGVAQQVVAELRNTVAETSERIERRHRRQSQPGDSEA